MGAYTYYPPGATEEAPEETENIYRVDLTTGESSQGTSILQLEDREVFQVFEAAIHNFSNAVAMRLENLEYQHSLEEQVSRQTRELEVNRAFLESIIDESDDLISVVDRDLKIIRVNPAAARVMAEREGQAPGALRLEGRGCHELFFGSNSPCKDCPAIEAIESGEPHNRIVPFPDPEHPQRWFDVSSYPMRDGEGELLYVVEVGRDITARKQLEDRLRQSLEDKELLLREVHHRVKNNLNMASSLLRLQFSDFEDPGVREAVDASLERLDSMSLVHEFLYRSDTQRGIDFPSFIERIVEQLTRTYALREEVRIHADIADIPVDMDTAVPVSLIVTELVTNSLKYAFPGGSSGTVSITTRAVDNNLLELVVADDGIGLPEGLDPESATSLGLQLVQGLSRQIDASLLYGTPRRGTGQAGTSVTLRFPRR